MLRSGGETRGANSSSYVCSFAIPRCFLHGAMASSLRLSISCVWGHVRCIVRLVLPEWLLLKSWDRLRSNRRKQTMAEPEIIWKFQGYEAAFPCLRESGSHLLGLHGLSIASWMVRKQLRSFSHNWSVKCLCGSNELRHHFRISQFAIPAISGVAPQAGSVAKPGGGRSGRVALGLQDKDQNFAA